MTESLAEVEQEKVSLTRKEHEKLLEQKETCEPFAKLVESEEWKKVKETLRDDIILNLHFSKDSEFYHLCWGIKMTIERIEARAKAVEDINKKLSVAIITEEVGE